MCRRTWSVLGKGTGEVTSARLSRTDASGRLTLPTAPTLYSRFFCLLPFWALLEALQESRTQCAQARAPSPLFLPRLPQGSP